MYHRVNDTSQDYNRITVNEKNFKAQMSFLKDNYKVLSLEDMLTFEGKEDVVALTFDDGFADFYANALPVLEEMNLPATIFVTTGKMDTVEELWTTEIIRLLYMNDSERDEICIEFEGKEIWLSIASLEQRASAYRCIRQIMMGMSGSEINKLMAKLRNQLAMDDRGRDEYTFLTEEQCRKLGEHSLVTVGVHTVNHISMGNVDEAVLEEEVKSSIGRLERILGKKVEYFAYPFGGKCDYSKKVIELLKQEGIRAAFTTHASDYQKDVHDIYEIPRVYVGNWDVVRLKKCLELHFKSEKGSPDEMNRVFDVYMGNLADDTKLWKTDEPIIIWGTGIRGRRIRMWLTQNGMAGRILAFADNNSDLWDSEIEGIRVWSPTKVERHREAIVIVYNTFGGKILKQLIDMGLEKLHWIICV